ncbi:hypothetical protein IID23_02305, partial [Patescibacteria group bacterium]|nr:hypothetical protein [Patescibacteria group bacterium]
VKLLSSIQTGLDDVVYEDEVDPDEDLNETIEGQRLLILSINMHRNGSFDLASKVYTGLQSNLAIQYLNSVFLGFAGRSEIRDLAERIEGSTEQRYQFDLTLHAVSDFKSIVFAVKQIEINTKLETGVAQETLDKPVVINCAIEGLGSIGEVIPTPPPSLPAPNICWMVSTFQSGSLAWYYVDTGSDNFSGQWQDEVLEIDFAPEATTGGLESSAIPIITVA